MIGLGGAIINGVTNVLVADIFPKNNSAYLSLLGVFYGIGALGLPLLTSLLLDSGYPYQSIIFAVSLILLFPFFMVLLLKFPNTKSSSAIPLKEYFRFFTRPFILLIGLFLFFQSAIEAIIPVWTPTFLMESFSVHYEKGLYAITISALSITLTRLFLSQLLKRTKPYIVVWISLIIIIIGSLILQLANSFYLGLAGVGLMGIGVASSFPVMLGYAAVAFPRHSGTTFSIVIGIALIGNTLLNSFTGYILNLFGIDKLNILLISFILIMTGILYIIKYKLLKTQKTC